MPTSLALTYRQRHALDQTQLAQQLGVSLRTLSRWENNPSLEPPLLRLALRGLGR